MAVLKTTQTDADVNEFINTFAQTDQRRNDSLELIRIMTSVSGYPPKMWGASIVGFGSYYYKSERSRQEGNWMLIGFSHRKAAISLYVYSGCEGQEDLLADLGKYSMGKACIYIKKLADINPEVLCKLMQSTITFLQSKYS